ncbi:PIN domain-containing protein (plasmid) [Skermanella mucosa]|uniref:PIN domain-containing protein n=1 Tax=Skermanella mucosa TaxID=1789672 RepID=UPI00192C8525|nr:PIN domain-containing protein [Skermanella mucosa]UEM25249.1 PIN domain-containing protein [Skermanella mucosa]
MFILDTDIISNLRRKRPHPSLVRWIDGIGWNEIGTTAFTVMEIQIGIERARRTDPTVADAVVQWLDGLISSGQPKVLSFDLHAAMIYGRMHETPELRNFLAGPKGARKAKTGADLAIAAIAITQGAVVATGNVADFLEIHALFPLPGLYNPLTGIWHVTPG